MISCPLCSCKITWRLYFPRREGYSCVKCGYAWENILKSEKMTYGACLGDWEKLEIRNLELELAYAHSEFDWKVFKGKCIFTAWQESKPDHFLKEKTLDEIIYWIVKCTQNNNNENWYKKYKENN